MPSDPERAVAHLLDPISLPAFLEGSWEREPLHVRRDRPDHYAGLFGLEEVERYLFTVRPRGNDLRLVARGRPPIAFHDGEEAALPRVYAAFRDGYTMNLNGVHRHWPAVHALADAVRRGLRCYTTANAYVTGPASQGFETHHDGHDVLVLQTCGSKRWRLYEVQEPLAVEGSEASRRDGGWGEPVREIELCAGDLLYLPRGTPHSAVTGDCCSVHLTIGLRPLLLEAVLSELIRSVVAKHAHWRRSVNGARRAPSMAALAAQLADDLGGLGPLDPVIEALEAGLLASEDAIGPGPGGFLRALERLPALEAESELECRAGHSSVLSRRGDEVVLTFTGGAVSAPGFCEPALRHVVERSRFRIGELPDGLTPDAKVTLCRRLVREGLLRVAGES
jgi:hypothetical protein